MAVMGTIGAVGGLVQAGMGIANTIGGWKSARQAEKLQNQQLAQQIEMQNSLFDRQKEYWALEDLQIEQAYSMAPKVYEAQHELVDQLTMGGEHLADQYRSQAATDVSSSFSAQRQQDTRTMALSGVNPNSGAMAGYSTQMAIAEAMGSAQAKTQASRAAESENLNRLSTASSMNFMSGIGSNNSAISMAANLSQNTMANAGGMFDQSTSKYSSGLKDVMGGLGTVFGENADTGKSNWGNIYSGAKSTGSSILNYFKG